MKFNDTLTECVKLDLEVGIVPFLGGEPGIGKSSFVEALAKSMDTQCFTVPVNQLADKADLTGARLMPTDNKNSDYKQMFFPHDQIVDAIEYAEAHPREWPILFLDEINRTGPDVTSAALTLVTLRKMGSKRLPANLRIVVAGNLKGNVTTLDEASLSRFSIYHVEPEAQTLMDILGDDLNPYVRKVLVARPDLVFQKAQPTTFAVDGGDDDDDDQTTATFAELFDAGDEMLQLTTPRTIDGVSRWLNTIATDRLSAMMAMQTTVEGRDITVLQEVLEGKVGNTEFTTLLMGEIANGISSNASSGARTKGAPKPNAWKDLKAATTMTELAQKVDDLNEHEKSGCLLYALYESKDNSRIIEALAPATTTMETDHMKELMRLAGGSALDKGNVEALRASGTHIANSLSMILDMV